ncbi:hypothetical protein C819_01155 [Lachnospiraceae bacterium 10-1]|jgi:hypothetical protein|nr:hypothetical protein C819_01155 [Lachnospiraceae bacterium 10-1]KAI4443083.1 hypothetical protein C824_005616 [Schaedlerella arabinosiphila]
MILLLIATLKEGAHDARGINAEALALHRLDWKGDFYNGKT